MSEMSDVIELQIVETAGSESWREIAYRINGQSLIDLVRDVELPFAAAEGHPEIAGSYGGLPTTFLVRCPELFLGNCPEHGDETWTPVFVCGGCGDDGCWPLEVRIETTTDAVVWRAFRQPHRPSWSHDRLGPFTLDRQRYAHAVAALTEAIAQDELSRHHGVNGERT